MRASPAPRESAWASRSRSASGGEASEDDRSVITCTSSTSPRYLTTAAILVVACYTPPPGGGKLIDIRFGPQVCGRSDQRRDPGVAGHRRPRRIRHGHGERAAHPPLPRPAGGRRRNAGRPAGWDWSALDPAVTLPSGARVRLGAHEWSSGVVDPRGFELLERFDLIDGLPRWRWRIGDVVIERELAMAVRPVLRGGGAPAGLRRPGPAGPGRRLHLAGRARRAAGRRPDARGSSRPPAARWSRARTGWPARAGRPRGSGGWACTTARRPPAGCNPDEDLWYAGRFAGAAGAPRRHGVGAGLGRRPGRRAAAGDRGGRGGPAAQPGGGGRGEAGRPGGGHPRPGRRRVRGAHRGRPGRGGRLPVVRRLVAGHDDLVRGAVPLHRPGRRGAGAAAGVRGDAVGGDAGQHRRHRSGGVQHRRRARCGSCTR